MGSESVDVESGAFGTRVRIQRQAKLLGEGFANIDHPADHGFDHFLVVRQLFHDVRLGVSATASFDLLVTSLHPLA